MMYALVHYPNVDTRHINQLRIKYDPQAKLIEPHITLMFPVSESIGDKDLIHHLKSILSNWQTFPIHLQGLQISSDDHLFLLIQEGNSRVIRLHDEIYTGILTDYWRKDLPFVPHLTLGVLKKESNEYSLVFEEAKRLDIDYYCMLDKLHLVKVNDDRSKIIWSKELTLAQ